MCIRDSDNINNLCAHSDFTVNSLAYSPETGILDGFGGADDVKNKIIRFTQGCEDNMRENPVIMLRTVRCAAELGYSIAAESLELINRCAVFIKLSLIHIFVLSTIYFNCFSQK